MTRTQTFLWGIILTVSLLPSVMLAQTKNTEVLFETTAGNIRIALYDETPQTRDNFLKITKMEDSCWVQAISTIPLRLSSVCRRSSIVAVL